MFSNLMHGFMDERFMLNVFNDLLNILYSWVEFDVCIALWHSWILKVYFIRILGNFMHDVLNGILDILFIQLLKVIFL